MILHTFNTWVLANLLHPVLLFIFYSSGEVNGMEMLTGIISFIPFSFLFSIPSLLLSCVIMSQIIKLPFPIISKWLTWLFLATAIPVLNLFLLVLIFLNGDMHFDEWDIIIPSAISVAIAILIRYKQFFKLFIQPKNEYHENTMV